MVGPLAHVLLYGTGIEFIFIQTAQVTLVCYRTGEGGGTGASELKVFSNYLNI